MATKKIPNTEGLIRQDNRGDNRGELWETFNVDLSTTVGKIKVSKKLVKVLDEITDLDNEITQAFEIFDGEYHLATDGSVYVCSVNLDPTDASNWSEETGIAGTGLGFETDMVVFDELLLISQGTDITSWDGASDDTSYWTGTVTGPSLQTNFPHILEVVQSQKETLFVTDKSEVHYVEKGSTSVATVELDSGMVACCLAPALSGSMWVGSYSEEGKNAYVYEIRTSEVLGSTPVYYQAYKVEGRAVLSIEVIDNVPYIITEKGNLQVFNGAGFTTVQSLPFTDTDEVLKGVLPGLVQSSSVSRPVHPKGMRLHNDSLYININTETVLGSYPKRTSSGIWQYSKLTSQLTHRYSFDGAKENGRSGPIMILDNEDTFLLAAGEQDSENNGMWAESSEQNKAYFITTEYESGTVQDTFEEVYLKAKRLGLTENIQLKYRYIKSLKQVGKKDRVLATGVLADTNVLNITTTVDTVELGDEVTVITGPNAGNIAHITKIETSPTVTSFTLDTDLGAQAATVSVEFENWRLHKESYQQSNGEYKQFGVDEVSPWIQYKVVMDGDVELRQFMSISNAKEGT